jgi:hypothetical protein
MMMMVVVMIIDMFIVIIWFYWSNSMMTRKFTWTPGPGAGTGNWILFFGRAWCKLGVHKIWMVNS